MVKPPQPPSILQLVERVFAIGPIAIKLTECEDLIVERGDERTVLPQLAIALDLGEGELELASGISLMDPSH